jgi:glycosyltransferase involved in cell wall biosynthesis
MTESGVSVIIPAHESARVIQRALRSVLAQTEPPREIIVVDDGSTDGTADAARALGADLIVLRQPNRGPGAARNAGVRAASSDLVCFLDADDEYLPEMVATLSRALLSHPNAEVASAAFFSESRGLFMRHPVEGVIETDGGYAVVSDFFAVERRGRIVCTDSVMVRRRAFLAVGGFREDIRFGEDVDLWCRLAGRFEWVFVNTPVSMYHHDVSTSATLRTMYEVWRTREVATTVLMTDEQMKENVRRELWASFRRYRRDWLSSAARASIQQSASRRARQLVKQIPPAPISPGWIATWVLAHAPAPVGSSVLALNRAFRQARERVAGRRSPQKDDRPARSGTLGGEVTAREGAQRPAR